MLSISRDEITDGPVTKALLVLAAPLVAQNLVHVANQVVDVFWLGRIGGDAVAAVGINFPVIALLFTVAIGISVGTQVVVSQRVGAEDLEGGRRAAFTGTLVGLAGGTVLGLVVFVFARDIMELFSTDPHVTELAAAYLAVIAIGIPIATAGDSLEAGFIGWGDARAALYINVAMVAANMILDPILIFGLGPAPELGVAGAAYATIAGYTGGLLFALGLVVYGRDGFVVNRDTFAFSHADAREIVGVGWPNAGQFVASQSVRVVIVAIVAVAGGAAGIAAYTIGARVASIAFIPAQGLQQALQSVVGQNLGAEKSNRASKATWVGVAIAAGSLAVIGAIQWFVPETLTMVFVPDAAGAELEYTIEYLQILAYGYWAIGATYLFQGGFNAARRTRTSLVSTLLQYWVIRLPIAAVGVYLLHVGVSAVFWAVTLSNVAMAVGLGWYYWYESSNGMNTRAANETAAIGD